MIYKTFFTLFFILALGIFLRLYQSNSIPPGVNIDEASFGFDAYSLLQTGKDRYGEFLPLTLRSFGTYLLPLYTYLTVIPVATLGLNIYSTRLVAIISSIFLLFITATFIFRFANISNRAKLLIILFVSISPWAIYFGRGAHEASLSLMIFSLSILFFIKSLSNPKWLTLTAIFAGLSGLSYYTEHYLNLILFPILILLFKDHFIKYKKYLLLAVLIFMLFQLPFVKLLQSAAFGRRIAQVNYLSSDTFNKYGDNLRYLPFGQTIYILREFTSHYIEYFSPRSLFFTQDPQRVRSIPDLSVFYQWMSIPLLPGLFLLLKKRSEVFFKILLTILILSPVPAALTLEPFYTMRTLTFLWVLTITIALGSDLLLTKIKLAVWSYSLIGLLFIASIISFYNSYFILLKYERGDIYGYEYMQLVKKLTDYQNEEIVVDSSRTVGAQIWIPFYAKTNPAKIQLQSQEIKNNYYNNTDLDTNTKIDNLEIRPIFWKQDLKTRKILIGDNLAISDEQIKEHKLELLFQINGLDGKVKLSAYQNL